MEMLGVPFEVIVSSKEEIITSTDPATVTEELSRQKAEAVADKIEEGIVIGADTVVSFKGKILGKPADAVEACRMITSLQGNSHMVYTGVTILCKNGEAVRVTTFSEATKVNVAAMTEEEIKHYVETGEPYDKAGGYGIQGTFGRYIEGIEGDFYNVVGLPVHRVYKELCRVALEEE